MKTIILILTVLLSGQICKAQVFENKLNIYFNGNTGSFKGEKLHNENGFIYPYLFPNMTDLHGYSGKALIRIFPLVSIGFEANQLQSSDWNLNSYFQYQHAQIHLQSVSPVLQVHTKTMEKGIFSALKVFAEVSPVLGQSTLNLTGSIIYINEAKKTEAAPTKSIDNYFGFKCGAGFEYTFSRKMGAFVSYSFENDQISSQLFLDDSLVYHKFSLGLFFRFFNNKRYSY